MLLIELYEHYGTWNHLSRELNLGINTYQIWRKQGYIPFKAQLVIEYKTNGLFKASEEHGGTPKKKRKNQFHRQKKKLESENSS